MSTTPSAKTPKPTIVRNPNFRGIFLFNSHNGSDLATNPDLMGTDLVYYWSQIEPQPGQYQWGVIDQDIQKWKANGKKVFLRIAAAAWTAWGPPWSKQATPQWVYDLGLKSVTELDGAILPQYWNPIFLQHYDNFINAFAQRYDGDPDVALVQLSVGVGGETKVDTRNDNPKKLHLWQAIGYTDSLWLSTILHIMTTYDRAFLKTPLVVMPDASFIGKTPGYGETMVLDYAVHLRIGIQNNGLFKGQVLTSPDWRMAPFIVSEQRNRTSQSGDTLFEDLATAMQQQVRYILIFKDDVIAHGAQAVLHQFATLAIP